MNTLQDLRDTLDTHAALVHDDAVQTAHARTVAVAGRARTVRRRRAASVAGAAALALVAVLVPSLLAGDRDTRPSDRELIGKVAPATLESLGYTYHFAEGVEGGEKHARVRLRASDEPRLITWASTEDQVGVLSSVDDHFRSRATDFDDFVLVEEGESGTWSVRAGGAPAAIAVYELGDERPEGVTVDGITFRETVGAGALVAAIIGEESESDVTLDITLPEGGLRVAELCAGVPEDHHVNVRVDDRGVMASSGCGAETFDPGAEGQAAWYDPSELGSPGETVRVRTWISTRYAGPAVQVDGARLGLAAYAEQPPVTTVAGWDVPALVEHEGHLWQHLESITTDPGDPRLVLARTLGVPTLVVAHTRGVEHWQGRVMVGNGVDATLNTGGGAGQHTGPVLQPGPARFPIEVRRGLTERTQLGLSLYERVD